MLEGDGPINRIYYTVGKGEETMGGLLSDAELYKCSDIEFIFRCVFARARLTAEGS